MKPTRFYLGLFLVTGAGLMQQIVQTRILSVATWYYLAFLIISLAMFGITAGAVWVYLRREQFSAQTLAGDLSYFCSAAAVVAALCAVLQTTLGLVSMQTASAIVVWFELILCLILPFFLSGIVVSLALTRSPLRIGIVYAVDLVGAAAGCLGALLLLDLTDGPSGLLWIAALNALAAFCFARSGIGSATPPALPFAAALSKPLRLFVLLAVVASVSSSSDQGLQLLAVKGKLEVGFNRPVFVRWNTFARISVGPSLVAPAAVWGPSPLLKTEDWPIEQHWMNIDGDAGTVTYRWEGDPARVGFLKQDITNLAHFLPGHRRAAVIGVGGGRDILSAHIFGVPEIIGVELNPTLTRLLTDAPGFSDFAGLSQLPGLRLYNDEARSWFARSPETFDIIQMSLVDTWAATGAGAFSLSENGLYTVDGWKIFLSHLTEHGVFTVSRWYLPESAQEAGRSVSVAVAALLDLGVKDPSRSIFLAGSGAIATLIVSRSPFSDEDLAILKAKAEELQYRILLCPGLPPASEVLGRIAASGADRDQLQAYTANLPMDLTPSSDERPFFFNQLPLRDPQRMLAVLRGHTGAVVYGNLAATGTLLLLFGVSLILVAYSIIRPLRPAIRDVGQRLAIGGSAYFVLIGAGFMCTEIGLLQRLSVFLGSPAYALSIVLFSIILSAGIGSLVSDRMLLDTRLRFVLWSLATGFYLLALPFWLPGMLHAFEGSELGLRASLCVLAVGPAGLLMGFGMPTGLRFVAAINPQPMPWFWAINGATGVLASSLAVITGIAFGIPATLAIGGVCYLLILPVGLATWFRTASNLKAA
jgi:spermidine synthase